jgi:phosphoribosyl 1,2-cyclic phosphodiesterase
VRVTVLGSGSEGNSALVEAEGVGILIDAGFSGRDIEARLAAVDVDTTQIAGIVVTHDHQDHTRGMGVLARRFGIPIYLTERTAAACAALITGDERVEHYTSPLPFRIGPFEVNPFLTVHDAVDPVAFTVTHPASGCKMGIATDLGRPTTAVRAALANCHVLILEANHDDAMLWRGPYPWSVKQRIASSHGHLSNRASAELLREVFHPGLVAVALAHLSQQCNDAGLARAVIAKKLDKLGFKGWMEVAAQAAPSEPLDIPALRKKWTRAEQLSLL